MSFATIFDFARSAAATYRDGNGATAIAPVDTPRFDHDLDGSPLGLIIEAGAQPGERDRLSLAAPTGVSGSATVFHAVTLDGGMIERRAYYTRSADAVVAILLTRAVRHRSIGVVNGFVPIRRGKVRYRAADWEPPSLIITDVALLADPDERPLIANG